MSKQAMIGMELAAQEILGVGETLTDEQWHLPSGAEEWSVKDVVAHEGCLMAFLVAAVSGGAGPDMGIEELNEVQVAQKHGLDGNAAQAPQGARRAAGPEPDRAGRNPGHHKLRRAAITVTPSADLTLEPRAVITSSIDDFLAWSTTRLPWQQLVSAQTTVMMRPAS